MKKVLLLFILFSIVIFAQTDYVSVDVMRGDKTTLNWTVTTDYSADEVQFVVKASPDVSSGRLLQRDNDQISGGDSSQVYVTATNIQVTIDAANTTNWAARNYYYDIVVMGTDTTTIFIGAFTVLQDISSPTDGTYPVYPMYIVALDTPGYSPSFLIGQDADNGWDVVSRAAFKDTLSLIASTKDAGVTLDDTTTAVATANVTAINTAITTLSAAGGGTLFFWGDVGDTIAINNPLNLKSNVDWTGMPTVWLKSYSDTDMVVGSALTNCKITGLTFDGNMANQLGLNDVWPPQYRYIFQFDSIASNIDFEYVTFKNACYRAISMREEEIIPSYENIRIDKCNFINMGASAIEIRGFKDVFITNSYFEHWNKYGKTAAYTDGWSLNHPNIHFDGQSAYGNGTNFLFSNNIVRGNDSTLTASNFAIADEGIITGANITGNIFTGNSTGVSGYWRNSSFTNNVFDSSSNGNWTSGLEINGDHNLISGNNITNGAIYFGAHSGDGTAGNRPTKQYGSHNVVENNKVTITSGSPTSYYCISLGGATAEADTFAVNNVIQNNVLIYRQAAGSTSGGGIYVGQSFLGVDGVNVFNNTIVRDTLGGLSALGSGIRMRALDGSEDVTIESNKIKGFGTGIQIDTLTTADTYSEIYILRNTLDDNTTDITNESANVTIKNNIGYITEASGQDSIPSGGVTSGTFAHGLDYTPTLANSEFTLTPNGTMGSASYIYVLSMDGTNITVNSDADPSSKTITFNWTIKKE